MLYEQQLSQLQIHDHSHYSTLHHLLNAYISLVADLQNASYPTYMHRAPTLCSSILLPINQKNKDYSISNEYKIKISVCLKIMVKQKALIFNNQYAHFFFCFETTMKTKQFFFLFIIYLYIHSNIETLFIDSQNYWNLSTHIEPRINNQNKIYQKDEHSLNEFQIRN